MARFLLSCLTCLSDRRDRLILRIWRQQYGSLVEEPRRGILIPVATHLPTCYMHPPAIRWLHCGAGFTIGFTLKLRRLVAPRQGCGKHSTVRTNKHILCSAQVMSRDFPNFEWNEGHAYGSASRSIYRHGQLRASEGRPPSLFTDTVRTILGSAGKPRCSRGAFGSLAVETPEIRHSLDVCTSAHSPWILRHRRTSGSSLLRPTPIRWPVSRRWIV